MAILNDAQLIQALTEADLPLLRQWLLDGGDVLRPIPPEELAPLALVARAAPPEGVAAAHLLLAAGALPHVIAGRGATALHWVVTAYPDAPSPQEHDTRMALFDCLLHACAAQGLPWPHTQDGWGVLHCAALRDRHALLLHLLDRGAPAGEADRVGDTALHVAYRNGHLGSAQALHRFWEGSPPKNHKGQTPFDALLAKRRMGPPQAERFALEAATPLAVAAGRRQRL